MALTEGERKKIYEEEKARLEAQEKLKDEKKSGCMLPLVILLFVSIALILVFGGGKKEKGSESAQMNPGVNYRGNFLVIKNNDSFSYDYIKVTLNGKFKKELPLSIPPGEEGRCDLSEFVSSDGERFNIFKYAPTEISISCESPGLGKLFYYGKFR